MAPGGVEAVAAHDHFAAVIEIAVQHLAHAHYLGHAVIQDVHVDWEARLLFSEHHLSHAASAFFPSPFGEKADAKSSEGSKETS